MKINNLFSDFITLESEMSARSSVSSGASATPPTTPTDIVNELLNYEAEIGEDDIPIKDGREGAEKSLLATAKRDGIRGLTAAPLVTTTGGQPDNVTWCVTGVQQEPNETVYQEGRIKWNGRADILFKDAKEGWYIR